MCLAKVVQHFDPPLGEQKAWKFFDSRNPDGTYRPSLLGPTGLHASRDDYETGKWYQAKNTDIRGDYRLGFHCFKTREDAERWAVGSAWRCDVLIEVLVRGVHTEGIEQGYFSWAAVPCWVAEEMFIP